MTGVYGPKPFILHAVLLHQTFVHCGKFLTAAPRRSLGRVSVPIRLTILSDQLPVVALVGHYPTNKLIGRSYNTRSLPIPRFLPQDVCGISLTFARLSPITGRYPFFRHIEVVIVFFYHGDLFPLRNDQLGE